MYMHVHVHTTHVHVHVHVRYPPPAVPQVYSQPQQADHVIIQLHAQCYVTYIIISHTKG